jgi:hypothetical protein
VGLNVTASPRNSLVDAGDRFQCGVVVVGLGMGSGNWSMRLPNAYSLRGTCLCRCASPAGSTSPAWCDIIAGFRSARPKLRLLSKAARLRIRTRQRRFMSRGSVFTVGNSPLQSRRALGR